MTPQRSAQAAYCAAHLAHPLRMLRGKIVHLRAVGLEIVELPGSGVVADELPLADAHGGVALVLPEQRAALRVVRRERRNEALALAGRDRVAVMLARVRGARHVEDGRHDVGQLAGMVAQPASLGDAARPVHDERRGDAAFVDPVLVEPERRVREVGPGGAVALVGVLAAGHDARVVAEAHGLAGARRRLGDHQLVDELLRCDALRDVLRAGAVVGQEDDQGVLELAGLLERLNDAADALVHAVDLRRIDLHAAQQPFAMLRLGPRRLGRIAVGQPPGGMDDAVLHQAREPLLAQPVPARVEPALVFGDVLLVRVQRPVRSRVGDVLEERRFGMILARARGRNRRPDR